MQIHHKSFLLHFKNPSGTSRGVLTQKETFILSLEDKHQKYLGECGLFRGLSADDHPDYEQKLRTICTEFDFSNPNWWEDLRKYPSIQFGLEQILKAREASESHSSNDPYNPILFPTEFTEGKKGIPINGLIWMGKIDFMKTQIKEKLAQNFHCIKLKIGVNWAVEKEILKNLRKEFSKEELELRVDANGAFSFEEANTVLQELADLHIHSIEQPIKARQTDKMAELCAQTPTPIALDEELIGIFYEKDKIELLQKIKPQYIILKPSLVGGWKGSEEWIKAAESQNINWWITSALESNLGLHAIAQWTFGLNNPMPQGLGTGGLFTNNFDSRLKVVGDNLFFL